MDLRRSCLLFAGWLASSSPTHNNTVGAVTVDEHVGFMGTAAEHVVGFMDTQKSPLSPTPRLMGPVVHLPLGPAQTNLLLYLVLRYVTAPSFAVKRTFAGDLCTFDMSIVKA